MHLGHNGRPCPLGGYFADPNDMEDDWEDVDDHDSGVGGARDSLALQGISQQV